MTQPIADHPHSDPGDGRTECQTCGKWVWLFLHSCKGVPVTGAAKARFTENMPPWAEVDERGSGVTSRRLTR
jgi:hypothetical protein